LIYITSYEEGRIIDVNEEFCRCTGYTPEEVIGLTTPEIGLWEDEKQRDSMLHMLHERKAARNIEVDIRTKSGQMYTILFSADIISSNNKQYLLCVAADISLRKQAEANLQKSEELLRETQRISKVGGWEFDVRTGIMTWTDEVYRIYGITKASNIDDIAHDLSFYSCSSRCKLEEAFQTLLEKGEPYDLELEFTNARGNPLWVRTIGRPFKRDGAIVRVGGNIIDITRRKRIERQVEESEEKFRKAFQSSPLLMCILRDSDGVLIEVNEAWCRVLGCSYKETVGRTIAEMAILEENAHKC
jgi:two-component system CheB/CheR fusion protein